MIYSYPALLPEEIIRRAGKLNVSQICDGIDKLGLALPCGGCMSPRIMPVQRGMRMAGTAVTVETADGDNFPVHLAVYAAPAEGYVLVVDGKNATDRAYIGDLIMGACKAIGFSGIVCDGLTRDRDGNIDRLDAFPVFSRGTTPRGPYKKNEGNVNVLITCGGVPVRPGDLIMGDSDGVVAVPREHIEHILRCAEEKAAYEEQRERTISDYMAAKVTGAPLPQLTPAWVSKLLQ